jgi:hypothetical protein
MPTTHVEAGSNTSTVTLRVMGGDEKEVSNLRHKIWPQVPKDSDPIKTALARASSTRSDLSSERAPHKNKNVIVTQVIKIWS